MRIANFRWPIADLALKKENLKFKLANRKLKYYLLPNYNPKSTENQLCGHKPQQSYLYQISHFPVKKNLSNYASVFNTHKWNRPSKIHSSPPLFRFAYTCRFRWHRCEAIGGGYKERIANHKLLPLLTTKNSKFPFSSSEIRLTLHEIRNCLPHPWQLTIHLRHPPHCNIR